MTDDVTGRVVDHLRRSSQAADEPHVRQAARLHVLDTVAAVISGRSLPAGRHAAQWVRQKGSGGSASVVGERRLCHHEDAAFGNAMCAHAGESDDSHEPSRSHPGASIVPTAIAVGEHLGRDGRMVLRAVVAGYEACALVNRLMWPTGASLRRAHRSTHGMGGLWGSAVAAGCLHGFDDKQMRSLLAYAAQLTSGLNTWERDKQHVEKAFVFAGMPAWNGVRAAGLVASGCPGALDALDGEVSFFSAFGRALDDEAFDAALSDRPVILDTNIKKYNVGSPAQAAVQAAEELYAAGVRAADVVSLRCHLPEDLARIVDNREMKNINVQYLLARTLVEGRCTTGLREPEPPVTEVDDLLRRTVLIADPDMEPVRQARVEADLRDGRTLRRQVYPVRGTKDDPMTAAEVEAKADGLIAGLLVSDEARRLMELCRDLASVPIAQLGELLRDAGH